jgi:O-antigen/teichoic acid export membrane protein
MGRRRFPFDFNVHDVSNLGSMIGPTPTTGEHCFADATTTAPASALARDRSRLARGATVSLAGRMTGRLSHILGQVVVARLFGAEAFGLYAVGWTVLRVATLVSPLGLQHGAIKFGSVYWQRDPARLKGVLLQSLVYAAAGSLVASTVLYALAPWLAERIFQNSQLEPILRWFAPALVFAGLLKVAAAATRISQKAQYGVLSEDVTQGGSQLFLILAFFGVGWGILGAVAASGLSLLLGLMVALAFVVRVFPETSSARVASYVPSRDLLRFSIVASLAGIATTVLPWTDRLMVALYRPAAEVGAYQAASQISMIFAIVLSSTAAIFSPMVSRLHRDGDGQRLSELYGTSTKWALYASTPLFLVVFFAGRELVTVVFGEEFHRAGDVLAILALGQLANVATGVVGLILTMTGRHQLWFLITAVILGINVSLNLLLIPRYGLEGAAASTAVSLCILFLTGLLLVRRHLGCWPYNKRYLKGLLAVCPVLVVLFSWSRVEGVGALPSLVVTAGIAGAGFIGLLAAFGLEDEDREFLRSLRKAAGSGGRDERGQ